MKVKLIKNYKIHNIKQKYYSRTYFKMYKIKVIDRKKDLKNYVLQFKVIFNQLINKDKLNHYTECL